MQITAGSSKSSESEMGPMSWLDEMEAADPAYPGDVSYPAARTRAGRGLYQLHAALDDGHLNAARDLIADWYARQANNVVQVEEPLRVRHPPEGGGQSGVAVSRGGPADAGCWSAV